MERSQQETFDNVIALEKKHTAWEQVYPLGRVSHSPKDAYLQSGLSDLLSDFLERLFVVDERMHKVMNGVECGFFVYTLSF